MKIIEPATLMHNNQAFRFGSKEYISIDKEYLLAEDASINFNIFTGRMDDTFNEPVLLVGKDSSGTNFRELSTRRRRDTFYVRAEDFKNYLGFLEFTFPLIIKDASITIDKKTEILYICAINILETIFSRPRNEENIRRAKRISSNFVYFVQHEESAIPGFLGLGHKNNKYRVATHSIHVLTFAIGLWLMINKGSEAELHEIALGCLLHDIGKIYIRDEILKKPGELTRSEFQKVMEHPRKGFELMQDKLPAISLDIILHHHEKITGKGYPEGLRGNAISDHAKIAAIADVYDALTTERPYGNAQGPFAALQIMKDEMVGQFEQEKFTKFIHFLAGMK